VFWRGRHSVSLLADDPSETLDLDIVSSTSLGTFQEARARTTRGPLTLVVHASRA